MTIPFQCGATCTILGCGGSPQILACDFAAKPLPGVSIYDRKSIDVNQQRRNWYSLRFLLMGAVSRRSRRQPLPPPPPTLSDDVMTEKRLPRYWPFVRGIQRRPAIVTSGYPNKASAAELDIFMSTWTSCWTRSRITNDMWCNGPHYI